MNNTKYGHLIPATLFTLFSVSMTVEDWTFGYDLILNNPLAFLFLGLALSLWCMVALFTTFYSIRLVTLFSVLFGFRCSLGWPLNLMTGSNNIPILAFDILLVLSSLAYLIYSLGFLGSNDRSAQFNAKHFGKLFLIVHALPVLFLVIYCFGISQGVSNLSGGYVHLDAEGIKIKSTQLVNDEGKKAHLIGMMHVGETSFYEAIQRSWKENPDASKVILEEGVSDRDGILTSKIDYTLMASLFDLQAQPELARPQSSPQASPSGAVPLSITKINADIDISEFSPQTHQTIDDIFAYNSSTDPNQMMIEMFTTPVDNQEVARIIYEDLLGKRNAHLMEVFRSKLHKYDELFIPWGALHLQGIEADLQKDGFHQVSEQYNTVFRWETLKKLAALVQDDY